MIAWFSDFAGKFKELLFVGKEIEAITEDTKLHDVITISHPHSFGLLYKYIERMVSFLMVKRLYVLSQI